MPMPREWGSSESDPRGQREDWPRDGGGVVMYRFKTPCDPERKSLGMDIEHGGFVGAKVLIIHFY